MDVGVLVSIEEVGHELELKNSPLMNSPRFASRLVRRLEQRGEVRWMFLSHVDDIADHAKFQRHFQNERIIHCHEVHALLARCVAWMRQRA